MSKRNQTKQNYKQPNEPRTTERDKIIETETWARFRPTETIYKTHPHLNDKRFDDIPVATSGFERNKLGNKLNVYAVMDIKNRENISKDQCVNLDILHEEEYFNCINGNEEDLISINLYSRSYLRQQRITNPLEIFTREVGEEISINCAQTKSIIPGSIGKKQLPRYWKSMKPPYFFIANRPQDQKYNQWIFEIQINTSGQYEDDSITDIIVDRMDKCIKSGSVAYIRSTYLDPNQIPLFVDINTPWFGKKNDLILYDPILKNGNNYRPKLLTYQYLKATLHKGVKLKVNLSASDLTCTRNVANANNCLTLGIYIEPYSCEKLLLHLKSDGITNIIGELKLMKWTIPLSFYKNTLGLSEVLHVNNDTSRIVLSPDHDLYMIYHRETSCLVLQKFVFYPEPRDIVRINNEQKLNSNQNKSNK